jgi:RHS repeat-associated protein
VANLLHATPVSRLNIFPNGTWTVYQYDGMNHLTNEVHYSGASQILAQYQYTVASDGTRLASTETRRESGGTYSTTQIAWTNDALHRLVREASSSTLAALNFTNKYVYDLAGNRLWKTNVVGAVMTVTSYSYNANDQLLVESAGSVSFTNRYDANGSLTNRSSASEVNVYSYNLEGRLATATINQQQTNRYFYNQSGIRTRMEIFGSVNATNIFLSDPQNLTGFSQVLEELPRVGAAPTATYTLGSQIISQEKSGTALHLMADGHGSTRLLTDSSGAVQNAFTYDGYGSLVASNAVPQTVYLYSGERFDFDLRQYYLRARYYNPTVGRFGVQDQMDGTPNDPLSLHRYAYCQNNPVNGRDPSGNETMIELSLAMSLGALVDTIDLGHVAAESSGLITESGIGNQTIDQIANQQPNYQNDTATIIIHGVMPHGPKWADDFKKALGEEVAGDTSPQGHNFENPRLKQDIYVFTWSGFTLPALLVPTKATHELTSIQLQEASLLIWMNGYDKINVISHSWGTTLSYDLLNSGGIEFHDWVTMGSPLKPTTDKPVWDAGEWINYYSLADPVVHYELYPPFPGLGQMAAAVAKTAVGLGGRGLTDRTDIVQRHFEMGNWSFLEHSAYWADKDVLDDLRLQLQ